MASPFFTALPGRVVQAADATIFVTEAGQGRPILFLHGLGWSHALWQREIGHFSGSYRVLAGDMRGHGRSAKPPGPYTMEALAADWVQALDACGVDELAVVGLSQGGMVAMLIAAQQPERVKALALLGTACRFSDEAWAGMEERGRVARAAGPRAAAETAARSVFSAEFARNHPAFVEEFIADRLAADAAGLGAAMGALKGFDVRDRLGAVTCPTLILHGTEDRVIGAQNASEIAEQIAGSELHLVEGAGHILPVERPEAVERHLTAFLGARYPA
ncbi:alpha/beta fold hydrolase [Enterovirga sp.]|uniref:alpha/beta fold hydrolase n=1 Tax=Enterovirga sp. TaxID=2026350 RepID=UPI002634663C|nr:alpha/beta fold hydrolase [Enterovirga sp.]MDB5591596.1 3-oxoadipate enol-lactonase [Enterovirga sp.]